MVLVLLLFIIAIESYGYETPTHLLITESAFINARATNDFLESIGYIHTDSLSNSFIAKTAVEWAKFGSVEEDDTVPTELGGAWCRYLNHFYDPVNDRGLDFYLTIFVFPYYHVTGYKPPDWALLNHYMAPIDFVGIVGGRAKFLTYRSEQIQEQPVLLAFPVYFIQENGIWKLSKF